MWLEEAFRDLKSFGWQLEDAWLEWPECIAHVLIFWVVAYAWWLLWGHALETRQATARPKKRPAGASVRRWSLFRQGKQACLLARLPTCLTVAPSARKDGGGIGPDHWGIFIPCYAKPVFDMCSVPRAKFGQRE